MNRQDKKHVAAITNTSASRPPASQAIVALLTLSTIAAIYIAADLLIPIAIALLVNLLLSPVVVFLARFRIPPVLSAAVLVLTLVAAITTAVGFLAEPAQQWVRDAPENIRELRQELSSTGGQLANIQELAEEVDELTTVEAPEAVQQVTIQGPGVLESLVGWLPQVLTFTGIVVFLSFFLLASGDTMLRRLTACGRNWTERRRIVSIARQIQRELSRYLGTVTIINLLLGATVAVAMRWLEVPNPMLWGAMVTVFNFAPYVGALVSTCVLTIVGLTTFESVPQALIVPATFLTITILEGQLLTPTILGRRMAMSPIVVFLSVIVWGWLWGVAGALIAVPMATSFKVVCDHVPGLRYIGNFMKSDRFETVPGTPSSQHRRPSSNASNYRSKVRSN